MFSEYKPNDKEHPCYSNLEDNKAWVTKSSCKTTANYPVEPHVVL